MPAVPPPDISELKLVGRNWYEIMRSSSAVRRARILPPGEILDAWDINEMIRRRGIVTRAQFTDLILLTLRDSDLTMTYPATSWIRINPLLDVKCSTPFGYRTRVTSRIVNIFIPPSHHSLSSEELEQYVSEPPICAITLLVQCWAVGFYSRWHFPLNGEDNLATAYDKDGLRIKDLIAVKEQMQWAQTSYCFPADGENTSVMAKLVVESCERHKGAAKHRWYMEDPLPRHRRKWYPTRQEMEAARADDTKYVLSPERLDELGVASL